MPLVVSSLGLNQYLPCIGSPDRLDAMVWAITELALKGIAKPELNLAYSDAKGLLGRL